jgi:two-component system, NtrC family, nitrogen regulation response regulator GlnG
VPYCSLLKLLGGTRPPCAYAASEMRGRAASLGGACCACPPCGDSMDLSSNPVVLVFEDDVAIRSVLDEALVGMGLRVQVCHSLADLMSSVGSGDVALVVTDFWGADHLSLAELDRRVLARLGKLAPTIVLSARAWTRDETAETLGVVRLLLKPFEIDQLETAVQDCLRKASTNRRS